MTLEFNLPAYDRTQSQLNYIMVDRIIYRNDVDLLADIFPDLPVITRLFVVPDGMRAEVNITALKTKIEKDFHPAGSVHSEIVTMQFDDNDAFVDLVWSQYFSQKRTETPVIIEKIVTMRNYRLVPITIHPFYYDSDNKLLKIIENIEFKLKFIPDPTIGNNTFGSANLTPSRYIDRIIRNLTLNPPPLRDDAVSGGAIAYIIGDWDNVAYVIEPLIEWRRKMGWTVDLIRVENNLEREDIKDAIQEAYEEWDITPEYVVLVGDGPGMDDNDYNLAYWNEQHGARTAYETDHHYTTLVGDDLFPEVAIGRLVFNSINMLEGQVEKIIRYESDPYMPAQGGNRRWQLRAAVAATDSRSGKSSIDICRWFRYTLNHHGFEQVDEFYWNNFDRQRNPTAFLNTTIDNGISFLLYRGWSHMNGYDHDDASRHRNGRMLPFVMLATCNTGDYGQNVIDPNWSYAERFSWNSQGGAIGAVGAAGATHTAYNNLFATSTMKAPIVDKVYSQGWATMAGKLDLMRHYAGLGDIDHPENRGLEAWLTEFYIYNLMGDPAVDLFTAVPRELDVSHPELIREGESLFSVQVNFEENDQPAIGTRVCLYLPDEFQYIAYTNSDGVVDFILDPELVVNGDVFLTVSGPNLKPYSVELDIDDVRYFLGVTGYEIDDDNDGESFGDDDGIANATERIELTVEITNLGTRTPQGNLSVTLSPISPYLELVSDRVVLDNSPRTGSSVNVQFVLDIEGGFPNGELAEIEIIAAADNMEWNSSFTFPVEGPELEFDWLDWEGDALVPGDTATAYITLLNIGEKGTAELEGNLISLTSTIEVLRGNLSFDRMEAGDDIESDGLVTISASDFHLRGIKADFALALEDENGIQDTAFFSLTISEVRTGEPFGLDNYGYICIDNTADSFPNHPRFNWIEIDPTRGGSGRNTNLRDIDEEYDRSIVIWLPFEFIYYGETFDRLTICSNGWVAFGDYSMLNSARNRHIPSGEVVPAMLCPFWDDLVTLENSGIYYWYDEGENRLIVEWSNLTRLGPRNFAEATETFQVILLDPARHPTATGDGDIIFQYLEVEDARSAFQLWDTPYATVGIASPDQTDGIEITYWGQLHPGAAPLEPGRAIRFTTMREYHTVDVTGRVLDAETGEPIPDAEVRTSYGNLTATDDDGRFILEETIVANGYSFTASKMFYNDSTISGIAVDIDENNIVNFQLLHPEFRIEPGELNLESIYEPSISASIEIENSGNGVLEFDGRINFPGEAEIWDLLIDIPVGEIVDDNRIRGVVWAGGYWIVSGGASGNPNENWFYIFSRRGNYLDRIAQPVESSYGIRDMDFVDGMIYAIHPANINPRQLLKISPETGQIHRTWDIPDQVRFPRALAIDAASRRLYIAGTTLGIHEFEFRGDSTLAYIDRHDVRDPRTDLGVQPFGMAIYEEDPDELPLYLYTQDNPDNNRQVPDISIYKVDPSDGSIMYVTGLEDLPPSTRGRGGICITLHWNTYSWVMAAVLDDGSGDHIGIFELGPNTTWLDIEPLNGEILPDGQMVVDMVIYTEGLRSRNYEFELEYTINADPGQYILPVNISVTVTVPDQKAIVPGEFSLYQNWPNPFNSATSISFNLALSETIRLDVIDSSGRMVASLIDDEPREAGLHTISFDEGDFSAGIYFYRLQAGSQTAVRKMILLK